MAEDKCTTVLNSENNQSHHLKIDNLPLRKCKNRSLLNKKKEALNVFESPSSSLSSSHSVSLKRRKPRALVRRTRGDESAIGHPLGISFAAVLAQVLYRRDVAAERISPDHLSMMCTSAVRESLAYVYGDKLDGLARNFEQSFGSTLSTLKRIYDSSASNNCNNNNFNNLRMEVPTSRFSLDKGYSSSDVVTEDFHSKTVSCAEISDQSSHNEEVKENFPINQSDQVVCFSPIPSALVADKENFSINQSDQVVCFSPIPSALVADNSLIGTFEKSVIEQSRSNDLKEIEIRLAEKKLQLEAAHLALNYDRNDLGRSKLEMERSKASLKGKKFKNQLEDSRHGELNNKCIDCLIAGLLVMSSSLFYGAYIYSYQRIVEATSSCTPLTKEYNSWWTPKAVSTVNSGLNILWCHVQVMSRMAFGVLMILAIAYLLVQRSSASTRIMPITVILSLLGVGCGYCGKLCVEALGGDGYVWLLYWEILCFLHFLILAFTPTFFRILYGPLGTPQTIKRNKIFPYWIRRSLFYVTLLVFLPLACGLLPFGSPAQWKEHFLKKALGYFIDSVPMSLIHSLVKFDA